MCFSATASFTSSAVIGAMGIVTWNTCKTSEDRYFASIPVLFAIQQFAEGFVWLSFDYSQYFYLQQIFTKIFVFFAWSVWPVLLPLSVYKMEDSKVRRKISLALLGIGMVYALFSLFKILVGNLLPVVQNFHIQYQFTPNPQYNTFWLPERIAYVASTLLPLFLSTRKGVGVFALVNLLFLFISFIFYKETLPSVWCFFAAILSGMIYWILKSQTQVQADAEMQNQNHTAAG